MPGYCRIFVEFDRKSVTLYYCGAEGRILDEEVFVLSSESSEEASIKHADLVHALVYDCLNYGINGRPQSQSKKVEVKSKKRLTKKQEKKAMADEEYGAGMSIWEQLRLLSEWSPLLSYGQRFIGTQDVHEKAIIVSEAAEWLAAKTKAKADDELVKLIANVLKSEEGEALVRWCVSKMEASK